MKYRHYVPAVAFSIGLGFALLVTAPAQAAVDMFIKIDDIKGESVDQAHKGEIDVLAWSWGMSSSAATASTMGLKPSQTKVLIAPTTMATQPTTATRDVDSSSPKLMEATVSGSSTGGASSQPMRNNNAPRSGSGGGDLSVTKYVDRASPQLMRYCNSNQVIPLMAIGTNKKRQQGYLVYELTNVRVTSCQPLSGGSVPTETISLNYEQIKWTYDKLDDKGSKAKKGNIEYNWKVEEGESQALGQPNRHFDIYL